MSESQTTSLPKQYDPAGVEAPLYKEWVDGEYFTARRDSGRTPYVIVIPPPNVTGVLHMGHGLNNTIQDVLIRFERMRGREAIYLPGTDHAGIATQNVIERMLRDEGKTRFDLGREAFVERVWQHVRVTEQTILEQLRAIGASCDWSRTRFTLDEAYSYAVRHVFVTLWEEGLVYRGHRVIHWCPRCLTSLSDEEAEFEDTAGKLYHIRYPLADDSEQSIVVATTRPETMFGDTGVAVHPNDEKTAWAIGKRVQLPLTDQTLEIVTDEVVDPKFGTGFVKVTPAHDPNDFDIGSRHKLPMPLVMDPEGRMINPEGAGNRVPDDFVGMDRFEARKATVRALEAEGLLVKVEDHQHAVRHCHRCHTVVEPRLSDQWFVKMEPLAEPALAAYRRGELTFVPERWGAVYENWLDNIRDWNISRQLWWGHRIPVFRCVECEEAWASREDPAACRSCGSSELEQDPDVLDTWFSSWLWPFATFGWPEDTPDVEAFYPGHTLVTASEILFFWVARMVMGGYHFLGERPFTTVCINGTVRDLQHRKMSKSLGNGIDPLEVVEKFGADALRFTAVSGAPMGTDVVMDPADLESTFAPGRNFCNKLWNIGRFTLTVLEGSQEPGAGSRVPAGGRTLADRWILSRLQRVVAEVTEALDRFRLNDAANAAYHFVWGELADWYVEQVKPRILAGGDDAAMARSVLQHAFETALTLLHPFVPYITETLWRQLPGDRDTEHLVVAAWPTVDEERLDEDAERDFGAVQALVGAVRSVRAEYDIAPKQPVRAIIHSDDATLRRAIEAERQTVERLGGMSEIVFNVETPEAGAHAVLSGESSVFVPLGDAIDVVKECARLGAELDRLETQLAGVQKKLQNENFVSRAPTEVVERERRKADEWQERCNLLRDKRTALGCS